MKTDIPCDVLKREYQVTEALTLVVAEKSGMTSVLLCDTGSGRLFVIAPADARVLGKLLTQFGESV